MTDTAKFETAPGVAETVVEADNEEVGETAVVVARPVVPDSDTVMAVVVDVSGRVVIVLRGFGQYKGEAYSQ